MDKINTTAMVKHPSNHPTLINTSNSITDEQHADLQRLEAEIDKNLASGAKLALALTMIRDGKLYREEYKTFEDYCKGRWGYGVSYCHRLAGMGEVLTDLKEYEDDDLYPRNEAQARIYTNLNTNERIKLVDTIKAKSQDDVITASVINKFKKELFPDKCATKSKSTKSTQPAPEPIKVEMPKPPCPLKCLAAAKKALKALEDKEEGDEPIAEALREFINQAEVWVIMEKKQTKHN